MLQKLKRYCGNVLCAVLALLLLAQLLLLYIVWTDALYEVPESVVEIVREQIAKRGVECRFGKLMFRPSGFLIAHDLAVSPPNAEKPTFTVERAAITLDLQALLFGDENGSHIALRHIYADGGSFFCPAVASPDHTRRVVMSDIRAVLFKDAGEWVRVETLQAHYGEMPITIHGQFLPPKLPSGGDGIVTPAEWSALNNIAAQMLTVRSKLEEIGKMSLEVAGNGDESGAVQFDIVARGDRLRIPLPAAIEKQLPAADEKQPPAAIQQDGALPPQDAARPALAITGASFSTSIRFDGSQFFLAGEPVLNVRSATWKNFSTGHLRLSARFPTNQPLGVDRLPARVRLVASNVNYDGTTLDYIRASVRLDDYPPVVTGSVVLATGRDAVTARVSFNTNTRAASASFAARLAPTQLLTHPKIAPLLPRKLETLVIHQDFHLRGDIDFAPAMKFERTRLMLDTGAAHFAGFNVLGVRAKALLTPERLEVTDGEVVGTNCAGGGSFTTGFGKTDEFRLLISGSFDPHLLNPFLGAGWSKIWSEVGIDPRTLPCGGVDVRARWGTPTEFIYVGAGAKNAGFRGVTFDHAEVRVTELNGIIALFDMAVVRNGLRAGGQVQVLDTEAPRKHRESIRLAFTGELPKEDIVRLAGGPLHKTLAPLIPTRPAKVGLRVRVHGDRSPTPDKYEIETDIEIPGPFKAWGQPFENFKGTAFFDSGNLCVDIKEVAYAGGRVATTSPWASNRAWLDSRGAAPLLTLDFKLTDARRSLLFENLKELAKFASAGQEPKKITTPQKKKPPATSPFSDDVPDNSQLMVTFNGSIVTNDFKTLAGKGHIVLADPNIPHLYIFGGLSRILSKIKFGFSDFKLDRAETDYTVRDCTLFFPDLRIKGADAEIESKGEYDMLADKMRFVAILNSRVGESVPVVGLLPKVLNKWTNLGLVRITGPLSAPDWSLDATPSGLFRDVLKSEKLGTPREPLPAAKP